MQQIILLRKFKFYAFALFVFCLFFLNGCCSARYSYYLYKSKGEDALKAKNYKKAQNYFSIIYQNETKEKEVKKNRICWAFYRLGVIAELTNDFNRARGYYWGDSVDEGFYDDERLINWYAKAGWKQMDELNCARTLEEILEFEKTEPEEENEETPVERKKEIIVQKRRAAPIVNNRDTSGQITATYNRSVTPPPPDTPAPFMVYY